MNITRKIFLFFFLQTLLIVQVACTGRENMNGHGTGYSGNKDPKPTQNVATYSNAKTRCDLKSNKLVCQIYILDPNGMEILATLVAPDTRFTWAMPALPAGISEKISCRTSHDTLSYTCDLADGTAEDTVFSVFLDIENILSGEKKRETQTVPTTNTAEDDTTPAPSSDPYRAQVVLLMKMNGENGSAIADETGKTVINNGAEILNNACFFSGDAAIGGGETFGGEDSLVLPTHSDYDLGNQDFTFEMDFMFRKLSPSYNRLFSRWDGPLRNFKLAHEIGAWYFTWSTNGSNNLYVTYPHTPDVNRWYHIAASRNGGTIRLFIDGNQVASAPISGSIATSNQSIFIGKHDSVQLPQFRGSMRHIRLTKGVGRYTTNFTPPGANDL